MYFLNCLKNDDYLSNLIMLHFLMLLLYETTFSY
jgi:hypothetical protein